MTPALLMVLVRGAFRMGQNFFQARDERLRAADRYIAQIPVPIVTREDGALNFIASRRALAIDYPDVFDINIPGCPLLPDNQINLARKAAAIEFGAEMLKPREDLPDWANGRVSSVMAVTGLLSPEAQRMQWARFGLSLVQTGIQALAADPSLTGMNAKAETLIGAFASKVDQIIGPDGIRPEDVDGVNFKERAAAVLLQASLSTIAENSNMVVSAPHWAEFVGAVLSPLAAAQGEQGRRVISLSRLPQLMRGPVAQAALRTLQEHQTEFLGERFRTDSAVGAVTQEILGAAVRAPSDRFDIANTFSQRGLTLIYSASLNAAATRPELFINVEGRAADSWRSLLGNVAGVLRDAPPPFNAQSGLADRLTTTVIDVAAAHLTQRVMDDFDDANSPWDLATGRILTSIIQGFGAALPRTISDGANPFMAVFNQDQAVEVVRIIAAQAAQTPHMLLGNGHTNEVYGIARAVATFMSNPNTSLASPADWRGVIAVALEEAAKNPGTLFNLDPTARPEGHLAVSLIGALLNNAAAAVRDVPGVGETPRRLGSVLFGDTLRQAIEMTLRAAANNASMLVDQTQHVTALNAFVEKVQTFVQAQNGQLGAAEWLWLYRSFVAEVIATGSADGIDDAKLTRMIGLMPGMIPADATDDDTSDDETPEGDPTS